MISFKTIAMRTVILIDAGHGKDTAGKRSPDRSFYEWKWNREIAKGIVEGLRSNGVNTFQIIPDDYELDMPLSERVKRSKVYCEMYGSKNVMLISIHANAYGSGRVWTSPVGWSAYTSPGKTASDHMADLLYEEAEKEFTDRRIRKDMSDGDPDWEENFYILKKTSCPAVLTENFFYSNEEECAWMLTEESKRRIIDVHIRAIVRYVIEREREMK